MSEDDRRNQTCLKREMFLKYELAVEHLVTQMALADWFMYTQHFFRNERHWFLAVWWKRSHCHRKLEDTGHTKYKRIESRCLNQFFVLSEEKSIKAWADLKQMSYPRKSSVVYLRRDIFEFKVSAIMNVQKLNHFSASILGRSFTGLKQ